MSSYVFIDSRVGDVDEVLAGLAPDSIMLMLNPWQDGVRQIAAALAGQGAVDSIHIVSHGADGTLYFGDSILSSGNLDHYRSELAAIGSALSADGDILLYGCKVAATAAGQRFIEQLSACTQADVAASTDATGAAALGGNWQLEAATGRIESSVLSLEAYTGILDVITGDNNPNSLTGTANDDLISGLGGNDTINGAAGFDRAVYSGASTGYSIGFNGGNFIVTDTNPANGNEGADRLINIETAQFTDGSIAVGLVGFQVKPAGVVPSVAGLPSGGFVVAWSVPDLRNNVYAQRYDAAGIEQGPEIWVNSVPISSVFGGRSEIVAFADGGFAVTWNQGGHVAAQRYDAAGIPQGFEFQVNTTFAGDSHLMPEIAALINGGFAVTWGGGDNRFAVDNNVYVQRYDADGVALGPQTGVNATETLRGAKSEIAALTNGGFVVAWTSDDGDGGGVYAHRYDAAGVAQGDVFRVSTTTAGPQWRHAITALDNGGFVVTWSSRAQDGDGEGVYAQRYDAAGVAQGGEFRVNTTTARDQTLPEITALNDGGFVVTWLSDLGNSAWGVYAQRYDAAGMVQGAEFRVSTTNTLSFYDLTVLADGGFLMTWTSNVGFNFYGVRAQRYDALGNVTGPTTITLDGDAGDNTIHWTGAQSAIMTGGLGADTLAGSSANDTLDGGAGNDTAAYSNANSGMTADLSVSLASTDGQGGSDKLISIESIIGSAFADIMVGDDNANVFRGGAGNDILSGGGGLDTADYGSATSSVIAELWMGATSNDGQGGADTLWNIENLNGSAFSDILAGDGNNNVLKGGAGNDGLYGGSGSDTADYSTATSGVVAELWRFLASNDGLGGADTLVNIENLTGSAFSDTLAGDDDNNNVFKGGAGNDALYGGRGADTADYRSAAGGVVVELWRSLASNDGDGGADVVINIENLFGSAFADILTGDNEHDNVLRGGAGNDGLYGGGGSDTADYSDAPSGMFANLAQFRANSDGWGGFDNLVNIENLIGSIFGDVMFGDGNANRLEGGGGRDSLTGAGGADSFVFSSGSGVDTVNDFVQAQSDKIHLQNNLNGSGITSGAQALAHATTVGANTVIDLGAGNSVTLIGVAAASLAANDFVIF
jgi:hypothetical protein